MIGISENMDSNSRKLSHGVSFVPGKIAERHLQRLAYVYVRQSSPKQVLHHRESQVNQYQLVQRAESLGWSPERIQVIDTDQGMSGQESASRNGFQELVSEVSLGHVGIIFGYEVSRLARNNRDWKQHTRYPNKDGNKICPYHPSGASLTRTSGEGAGAREPLPSASDPGATPRWHEPAHAVGLDRSKADASVSARSALGAGQLAHLEPISGQPFG